VAHPASTGHQVGLCPCQGSTSCPNQDSNQGWHSMLPTTQTTSPPVRACRIWRLRPIRRPGDRLTCLLTLPVKTNSMEAGLGLRLWDRLPNLKKASPARTPQHPALVVLCQGGVGSDSGQLQEGQGGHAPCP